MANWKEKINITKILEMEESKTEEAGKEMGKRLRSLKYASNPEFLDIIERFENTSANEEEFNYILQMLYDWADIGHRLWIETILEEPADGTLKDVHS